MAPESPVDELSEKHKLILIKREVAADNEFPSRPSDVPSKAEAALIALALVSTCNEVDFADWAARVLNFEDEHAKDKRDAGKRWAPIFKGDWAKPNGIIHSTTACPRAAPAMQVVAGACIHSREARPAFV